MPEFDIYEEGDIWVSKNGTEYLTVKRKHYLTIYCNFYFHNKLILKSALFNTAFYRKIWIKFQDLPDVISIKKISNCFTLQFDDHTLIVRRSFFHDDILYLNGNEVGRMSSKESITVGHRAYTLKTEIEEEKINLYFLLLYLMRQNSIV